MDSTADNIIIRKVGLLRPLHWLRAGWQDFMAHPGPSLMYGILVTVAGLGIVTLAAPHAELFSTVISGFVLIAPLIAAGIYELTRQREAGGRGAYAQQERTGVDVAQALQRLRREEGVLDARIIATASSDLRRAGAEALRLRGRQL